MKSFIGRRSALGTLLLISSLLVPSQSKADLEGAYESQSDLKEYRLKTCLELEYNPLVYAEIQIPGFLNKLIIDGINGKNIL